MARQKTTAPAPEIAPADPLSTSGYTVLARRYRPQTFADLVGQEPIARALTNAIESNRVAHAYLFTGTRGVGKTSTARILAKALNCEKGPTVNPCGVCEICQSVASGEDVDVLEIDAASNRGVDEARDLRTNVQYSPARARYKIYIIDEVHMLTREAFNALLKTLEEPPPHVKFILATTDAQKVPITILSRCQRFDFTGIPLQRMLEHLRKICVGENISVEDQALELVARRSGGSMRDAESLLDQLLAFGGAKLTADQVHHLLGTAGDDRIIGLADAILAPDAKKSLELLDEACLGGLQLGELVEQLIAYWRDLMVMQCSGMDAKNLSVSSHHHATLARHAKAISTDAVLAGLDVLSATRARMQRSNHPRTLVEMALVRLGKLGDLASLTQLSQWLGQVRLDPRGATQPMPGAANVARNAGLTVPPEGVKKKPLSPTGEEGQGAVGISGAVELTTENWPVVLQQFEGLVGKMLTAKLAQAGVPAILGPNSLAFRFAPTYNQAKEYVQNPERLARVEEALARVTNKTWKVSIESDPTGPASVQAATQATVPANRPRGAAKEEAERVPLVKRALEVLGGTVQRVDEGFGITLE